MKYLKILSLPITAILLVAFISACAPVTKQSIRQNAVYTTSFTVNKPYQDVFDALLKRSQSCYLHRPNYKQLTLVGNRDYGKNTANITLEYVYAMAEHDVILMVDISAVNVKQKKQTQVYVYAGHKGDKDKADVFEKWLADTENKLGCDWKKSWLS